MTSRILLAATVAWPSVARYAGGFAAAGCVVQALSPRGAPVTHSRYVTRTHPYRALFARSSWRKAITEAQPDLIVGCDDRAIAQMIALYDRARDDGDEQTAALIERSLGSPDSCRQIMARNTCMQVAREIRVRVPDTFAVADAAELDAALGAVGYPAVVKSDGSWGGDGVIVAKNRDEAIAAYHRLRRPASRPRSVARAAKRRDAHFLLEAVAPAERAITVQRFIAGTPAASAFAAWQGEIVATIAYDVLVADGTNGPPNVIRRVHCPEIDRAARLIARHFGLSGLHGMDFIRDEGGAVHLLEINPRATQGGTLAFGPGADLPSALADCIAPGGGMRTAIANDTVAIFPREWQRDPASPYLKSAHHDVPWDDPAVLRASLV